MNNFEKNPLVSVIVPVYNVEKYLKRCLDSIVNQTYKNIEVICIDDGSPDNSINILREFEKKDNRIKIIRQKNMGLSKARNVGIDYSSGKYILFVDSDDCIENNMVELMLKKIEDNKLDLVICGNTYVSADTDIDVVDLKKLEELLPGKVTGEEYFKIVTSKTNLFTATACNKIYKTEMIKNKKIRFPEGKLYEDLMFSFKYLLTCSSVGIVTEAMYNYFIRRDGSITNKINTSDIDDAIFTYKKLNMFLKEEGFEKILESIEYKDYIFLWITRATVFKLVNLTHIYSWKELNIVINSLKQNKDYRALCREVLSKSSSLRNKICIKTLFLNNKAFIMLLKLNNFRHILRKKLSKKEDK